MSDRMQSETRDEWSRAFASYQHQQQQQQHHHEDAPPSKRHRRNSTAIESNVVAPNPSPTLVQRSYALMKRMTEKLAQGAITNFTEAFLPIYAAKQKLILDSKPIRVFSNEGYIHEISILSYALIMPTNNGEALTVRLARQRGLSYMADQVVEISIRMYDRRKDYRESGLQCEYLSYYRKRKMASTAPSVFSVAGTAAAAATTADGSAAPATASSMNIDQLTAERKKQQQIYNKLCRVDPDEKPVWERRVANVHIGALPIMVGENGNLVQPGQEISELFNRIDRWLGYFVVSGRSKVLSPLERLANNSIYFKEVESSNLLFSHQTTIRAQHHSRIYRSTATMTMWWTRPTAFRASINSKRQKQLQNLQRKNHGGGGAVAAPNTDPTATPESSTTPHPAQVAGGGGGGGAGGVRLLVDVPFIKQSVSFMVLLVAMGWSVDRVAKALRVSMSSVAKIRRFDSSQDAVPTCDTSELLVQFWPLVHTLVHDVHEHCADTRSALLYLYQMTRDPDHMMLPSPLTEDEQIASIQRILRSDVVPQQGMSPASMVEKGMFMCEWAVHFWLYKQGYEEMTDIDGLRLKRFDLHVRILMNMERQRWGRRLKRVDAYLTNCLSMDKALDVRLAFADDNTLTRSMATGQWSAHKNSIYQRKGMTQGLPSINQISIVSTLQRVSNPEQEHNKSERRRQVSHDSFGRVDPSETSDGSKCGMVKNMSMGARITTGHHSAFVECLLRMFPYVPLMDFEHVLAGTAIERRGMAALVARHYSDTELFVDSPSTSNNDDWMSSPALALQERARRIYEAERLISDGRDDRTVAHDALGMLDLTKLYVNGVWLGWVRNPLACQRFVRACRRNTMMDVHVEYYDPTRVYRTRKLYMDEIRIYTEASRIVRPLALPRAVLDPPDAYPPDPMFHVVQLQKCQYVEFVDASEEQTLMIARSPEEYLSNPSLFTHIEICQDFIFGVNVSSVPYAMMNPTCRATYQSGMAKQWLETSRGRSRNEANALSMYNGQSALVTTEMARAMGLDTTLNGFNCNVCLHCDDYDIEDAQNVSQSIVDMGVFRAEIEQKYRSVPTKNGSGPNHDRFERPPTEGATRLVRNANYDHLDDDGLVAPDTFINERSIVIGKTSPVMSLSKTAKADAPDSMRKNRIMSNRKMPRRRDVSTSLKRGEGGIVACSTMTIGKKINTRSVSVSVRSCRPLGIGEKMSNRHGQKGTIGIVTPRADLPFDYVGRQTCVLSVNLHALHSRATVGMLKEMLVAKAACWSPDVETCVMAGPMHADDERLNREAIERTLLAAGLRTDGKIQTFVNGRTGERMVGTLFTGTIFYYRLRHMVVGKYNVRPLRGPRTKLLQPTEGRGKQGGLRMGYMEVDCLFAHGCAEKHRERMNDLSDGHTAYICYDCGFIGEHNADTRLNYCRHCRTYDTLCRVQLPFIIVLIALEWLGVGVRLQFKLKRTDVDAYRAAAAAASGAEAEPALQLQSIAPLAMIEQQPIYPTRLEEEDRGIFACYDQFFRSAGETGRAACEAFPGAVEVESDKSKSSIDDDRWHGEAGVVRADAAEEEEEGATLLLDKCRGDCENGTDGANATLSRTTSVSHSIDRMGTEGGPEGGTDGGTEGGTEGGTAVFETPLLTDAQRQRQVRNAKQRAKRLSALHFEQSSMSSSSDATSTQLHRHEM